MANLISKFDWRGILHKHKHPNDNDFNTHTYATFFFREKGYASTKYKCNYENQFLWNIFCFFLKSHMFGIRMEDFLYKNIQN